MRILDQNGTEMLEADVDYEKGYLVKENIFVCHHEAVEAVVEEGHWVTIREYPNGGKDVDWVIDVPAVEASDAWDEYEDILRYTLYTADELAEIEAAKKEEEERQARLNSLTSNGITWDDLASALKEGVNSI